MAESGFLGKRMGSGGLAEELPPCGGGGGGLCEEEDDSPAPSPQPGGREEAFPSRLSSPLQKPFLPPKRFPPAYSAK